MIPPASLRRLHRLSALVLGAFLILHLGNHLAGLAGQDVHRAVQLALRPTYRGWTEPLLLAACALQAATGLRLAWARRRARGWGRAQALSGAYLALFLAIHLAAVLSARAFGVDPDLAFAAAGLHAQGLWPAFFVPYYGFAIVALAVHLSVPLRRRSPTAALTLIVSGIALAGALLALLSGYVTPLHIPHPLLAKFGG